MNRTLLRPLALALALVLVISAVAFTPSHAADTGSLGQLADSFASNGGSFTLSDNSRLYIVTTAAPADDLLAIVQTAQQQFASEGIPTGSVMPIVWGDSSLTAAGDILIAYDPACGIGADGYRLDVNGTATVTAANLRGILYGLNALQKHFRIANGSNIISGFNSTDVPDTAERTVSLDFARKYYSKDWICNFIRQMSWMGYNTLQLHLAEDSGIRMDIWDPAYYKGNFQPVNDFSWICGSENAYYISLFSPNGVVKEDVDKDRYLTTAEMIEILETAKQYQINIVPSFDSPGHMDYLTWKFEYHYQQLQKEGKSLTFQSTRDGKTYDAATVNGIINYTSTSISTHYDSATGTYSRPKPYYKAFDVNNAVAKAFVFELYSDLANFFKEYSGSSDFSICADEVVLDAQLWGDPNTYTYNFGYQDFINYINELHDHLSEMGYAVRAYNDFIGSTKSQFSGHSLSEFPADMNIMYWSSNFNSVSNSQNSLQNVNYFTGNGRKVYNCISDHTYYAMAYSSTASGSHPDCRCPGNTNWTMGDSTEQTIYEWWYPANFAPKGDYTPSSSASNYKQTYFVDAEDLAGAYFLIWSDNPMLTTEAQIWNGFYSCDNDHLYVSLFDRMWSNTIKMWNWDINSSLTFADFTALRDAIKFFPGLGYNSTTALYECSSPPNLPAATEPVCLSERAALKAELDLGKRSASGYTSASYAPYSTAYDAAAAALASGTDAEISVALKNLLQTKSALVTRDVTVNITYKDNATKETVGEPLVKKTSTDGNEFEIYLPRLYGYTYSGADGAALSFSPSGDGSGFLRGTVTEDIAVTIWLTASKNDDRLQNLMEEALSQTVTEGISYTDSSWSAYATALNAAKSLPANATQVQVDTTTRALRNARTKLVIEPEDAGDVTLSVELLNEAVPAGKQIVFYVSSSAAVSELIVTKDGSTISPILCTAEIQQLDNGSIVKRWMITTHADESGEYTISDGTESKTLSVTVN